MAIFSAETQSVRYIHSDLLITERDRFHEFHDFSLMCGQRMATVLLSSKEHCRNCHNQIYLDPKAHPVVIYSLHRGTFLGCQFSKLCRMMGFAQEKNSQQGPLIDALVGDRKVFAWCHKIN